MQKAYSFTKENYHFTQKIPYFIAPILPFFNDSPPPFLPETTNFIGCILCIVSTSYKLRRKNKLTNSIQKKSILQPIIFLTLALLFFIAYRIELNYCTVIEPQNNKEAFQIGFGKLDISLTNEGKKLNLSRPSDTPQEWMLAHAAFRPGGPAIIWESWSINLAGSILVITYTATFLMITWGLCDAFLLVENKYSTKKGVRSHPKK